MDTSFLFHLLNLMIIGLIVLMALKTSRAGLVACVKGTMAFILAFCLTPVFTPGVRMIILNIKAEGLNFVKMGESAITANSQAGQAIADKIDATSIVANVATSMFGNPMDYINVMIKVFLFNIIFVISLAVLNIIFKQKQPVFNESIISTGISKAICFGYGIISQLVRIWMFFCVISIMYVPFILRVFGIVIGEIPILRFLYEFNPLLKWFSLL
ncbi:hypothetical protein M2146_001036 [Lachnospiraceae bacterium PF1-22]